MVKLWQIARQFELDKNTAQAETQDLRRKLADVTNQEEEGNNTGPPSKRSRTNDNLEDSEATNEETQIINAGHQFVILYVPWLRSGDGTFKATYDPESIEAERFENHDNKVQGQIREIRKVLGAHLTGEMSFEAWIAKAVSFHCLSKFDTDRLISF